MGAMNVSRLDCSRLNASVLNRSALNASGMGLGGGSGTAIPPAIRDSMVVWYDIARQGATNESMQANPVLKDFSGHGRDATCYNFAWSGNSGIGGVIEDFTSSYYENYLNNRRGKGTVTYNKIHITQVNDNSLNIRFFEINSPSYEGQGNKSYKIRVTGVEPNKPLAFSGAVISGSDIPSETLVLIDHDGEYTIPETNHSEIKNVGYRANGWTGECNIVIEQLPPYPNALVSDGVDDYAKVGSLPILTKEGGYTVIAKRKWIDSSSGEPKMLLSDGNDYGHESLMVENKQVGSEGFSALSFGSRTNVNLSESDIIYQTSTSYCGNGISSGQEETESSFSIFSNFGLYDFSKIALYSLLLFDRDLTDEEIDWVRQNLMGDVSGDI